MSPLRIRYPTAQEPLSFTRPSNDSWLTVAAGWSSWSQHWHGAGCGARGVNSPRVWLSVLYYTGTQRSCEKTVFLHNAFRTELEKIRTRREDTAFHQPHSRASIRSLRTGPLFLRQPGVALGIAAKGRKLSDPLECTASATRQGLIPSLNYSASHGHQQNLSRRKYEAPRSLYWEEPI